MTDYRDMGESLEPDSADDLLLLAQRLRDARPTPRPAFRGDLGRQLSARERTRSGVGSLRAMTVSYAVAGVALLSIGTLSAAGLGPLG